MRTLRTLFVIVLVVAAAALQAGCGTWSIGRGPTDLDLKNDGSTEAQKKLRARYELTYERGMIARPGADKNEVAQQIGESVSETRTPAYSENAADYLSTSDIASDATDTAVVGFDRFAHSNVPVLGITGGCVLIGAAVGVAAGIQESQNFDSAALGNISYGAFNGAIAGLLLAIPIEFIYSLSVPLVSSSLASSDYRKGVRAFNKDLELRILQGGAPPAEKPAAAPAPAPAPVAEPVPVTPPPVEPPSGG